MFHDTTTEVPTLRPKRCGKFWLWPDGTMLPVIRGGDGDDDENDDDDEGDDSKKPKFTSAEVAAARKKAQESAQKALLKALGFESMEQAGQAIKDANAAKDKDLSDKAKAEKERDEHKAKAGDLESRLAKVEQDRDAVFALIEAGLSVGAAKRAHKLMDLEPEADAAAIKTAVEDLKKEMPNLFTTQGSGEGGNGNGTGNNPPPPPSPGAPPKNPQPPADGKQAARSLLHERHPKTAPKQ